MIAVLSTGQTAERNHRCNENLFPGQLLEKFVSGNILSTNKKTILLFYSENRHGTAIHFNDCRLVEIKGILPCCNINPPVRIRWAFYNAGKRENGLLNNNQSNKTLENNQIWKQ